VVSSSDWICTRCHSTVPSGACTVCGNAETVPIISPRGAAIAAAQHDGKTVPSEATSSNSPPTKRWMRTSLGEAVLILVVLTATIVFIGRYHWCVAGGDDFDWLVKKDSWGFRDSWVNVRDLKASGRCGSTWLVDDRRVSAVCARLRAQ